MKPGGVLAVLLALSSLRAEDAPPLKLIETLPLPAVQGRFDHFAIDTNGHRLFVAALGNNTLEVIDIGAGQRLKSIGGLHKPTGVLFLAEQNQIIVANGDDGTLRVFDGISYELVKTIGSLDDADNLRFDPKAGKIYVGYADGALAVIDPVKLKQVGSIKLAAHPESFQLEAKGPRIFVNVPDARQVAVIDREQQAVIASWPMTEFKANFPMALDEANHRLFVGCRQPARLVVLDTTSGKSTFNLEISGDTDDLYYDPGRDRIYLSCGQGFLEAIGVDGRDHCERLARLPTRAGARTSFFSPSRQRFYLAVPQSGSRDAEIQLYAAGGK